MCLIVRTSMYRKKAKKDIKVYKVLRKVFDPRTGNYDLYSPYMGLVKWGLGITYNEKKRGLIYGNKVGSGYLHSYKTKESALCSCNLITTVVFEATIPKGTYYYEGTHTQDWYCFGYASKSLRIDKEITV